MIFRVGCFPLTSMLPKISDRPIDEALRIYAFVEVTPVTCTSFPSLPPLSHTLRERTMTWLEQCLKGDIEMGSFLLHRPAGCGKSTLVKVD